MSIINKDTIPIDSKVKGSLALAYCNGTIITPDDNWAYGRKFVTMDSIISQCDKMSTEPAISASESAYSQLISGANLTIETYGDDKEDQDVADFIKSAIDDMNINISNLCANIIWHLFYRGCFVGELGYKVRSSTNDKNSSRFNDNKIGITGIYPRDLATITKWYLENDNLVGVQQVYKDNKNESKQVDINSDLLFHLANTTYNNNPLGEPIVKKCYKPHWFIERFEKVELIGVEKDATNKIVIEAPLSVLTSPDEADREIKDYLYDIATNYSNLEKSSMVIPSDVDSITGQKLYSIYGFQTGGSSSAVQIADKAIKRNRELIHQILATDFITIGSTGGGSLALSSNKLKSFLAKARAYANLIEESINVNLIKPLMILNGFDSTRQPSAKFNSFEIDDVIGAINALCKGIEVGLINPTIEQREWLLNIIKAPANGQETQDSEIQLHTTNSSSKVVDNVTDYNGDINDGTPTLNTSTIKIGKSTAVNA